MNLLIKNTFTTFFTKLLKCKVYEKTLLVTSFGKTLILFNSSEDPELITINSKRPLCVFTFLLSSINFTYMYISVIPHSLTRHLTLVFYPFNENEWSTHKPFQSIVTIWSINFTPYTAKPQSCLSLQCETI